MRNTAPNKRARPPAAGCRGFTLAELMIAIALSAMVLAGLSVSFYQGLRAYQQEQVYNELSYNLEVATERIRQDLRLSSVGVGLMTFYPAASAEYTAISMPMAEDSSGDGFLDRDGDGKLVWRKTVIYHVEPGSPDKLMRTTFSPRDTNATPTQVYNQLAAVATASNQTQYAAACLSGESVEKQQIFANLVEIRFRPSDTEYDGYAPAPTHGKPFNWGSVVLGPGLHNVTFLVMGKNEASTGYKVGVDRFHVSRSASWREGESFTPIYTRPAAPHFRHLASGGAVSATLTGSDWAWSGNAELTFQAAAPAATITFEVYNDLWCDTTFDNPAGTLASNAVVQFDHSFTNSAPYIPEKTVAPDKGVAWVPSGTETNLTLATTNFVAVTNILYGTDAVGLHTNLNMAITRNGCWARFLFERVPESGIVVTNAMIVHPGSGVASNITFNGGDAGLVLDVDDDVAVFSDWVPMWETAMVSNYWVRFDIAPLPPTPQLDMLAGRLEGCTAPGYKADIVLYRNSGTPEVPQFGVEIENPYGAMVGDRMSSPKLADIDGDGRLDLFIGRENGRITYYRNSGTCAQPQWTWVTDQFAGTDFGSISYIVPAFVDIDGDGDLDLFVGSKDGKLYYVQNTGNAQAPAWAAPVAVWEDIIDYGSVILAPEFADIDNNGKPDLFLGVGGSAAHIAYYQNTGTVAAAAMRLADTGWNTYSGTIYRPYPAFADIDNDGDLDLFVGERDGQIKFFRNTGTAAAPAWAAPDSAWQGIQVVSRNEHPIPANNYASPTFGNLHSRTDQLRIWRYDEDASLELASTNGAPLNASVTLAALEVGYPKEAVYRSGVFDTQMQAPEYNRLVWTQKENWPAGDVDVRIRSSHTPNIDGASWTEARLGDEGYFQGNTGNNLTGLGRRRFVQYEAIFLINANGNHPHAHTNRLPDAVLRDVTIDWPGEVGLVDLVSEFGRRPDGGITTATVDGRPLVKGVQVEMEIFKRSRVGMHSVSGILEVKPLNTGK